MRNLTPEEFWALVDRRRPKAGDGGSTIYKVTASSAEIKEYLGAADTHVVGGLGEVAFYYESSYQIVAELKPKSVSVREPDRYAGLRAKGLT